MLKLAGFNSTIYSSNKKTGVSFTPNPSTSRSKMGARRDPIYSPVEKMEEENSNTASQKKKEGQRKRINLMIGLVCGLALFAGVAILSTRPPSEG